MSFDAADFAADLLNHLLPESYVANVARWKDSYCIEVEHLRCVRRFSSVGEVAAFLRDVGVVK